MSCAANGATRRIGRTQVGTSFLAQCSLPLHTYQEHLLDACCL
jgi:hypothetical protein